MDAGTVIKKLRREKGLTQQGLADRLHVSKASVQKYEQGDVLNLKAETLRKLCLVFDVPPFLFVFPEQIDGGKEMLLDAYKWEETFKTVTLFNNLCDANKLKVIDLINILTTVEYHNKKE